MESHPWVAAGGRARERRRGAPGAGPRPVARQRAGKAAVGGLLGAAKPHEAGDRASEGARARGLTRPPELAHAAAAELGLKHRRRSRANRKLGVKRAVSTFGDAGQGFRTHACHVLFGCGRHHTSRDTLSSKFMTSGYRFSYKRVLSEQYPTNHPYRVSFNRGHELKL